MNSFIKLSGIMMLVLCITSCDYLDLKPKHSYVEKDMLKTEDNAKAAVNGTYLPLINYVDEFAGSTYVALSARSGIIKGDWTPDFEEKYKVTSDYSFASKWSSIFIGINYTNFAITGIESMPATAFKDEALRKALIGEARLMRAFYNIFQLYGFAKWWETDNNVYGILYRDQVSTLTNMDVARLSVGESYARIIADLDAAIAACPTLDQMGSSKRVSQEFAKVLKAKLLLFRGAAPKRANVQDLRDALALVNSIFANKPKKWVMESDMAQMYLNSFDSKENLFVRYNSNYLSIKSSGGFVYGYATGYLPSVANNQVTTSEGKDYPHDPNKFDAGFESKNLDWIKADPRWKITTGIGDNPETWDVGTRYMSTKLYRNGYLNKCDYKFNVYYFRLYELYLLKAELILRTGGSYADALAVINEARSLRSNPVLPALVATNDAQVYDLIYKEYVCENYFENGSDYFASLRIPSPDGDLYIEYNKKGNDVKFSWDQQIYPIPGSEMANNKKMIQTDIYQ